MMEVDANPATVCTSPTALLGEAAVRSRLEQLVGEPLEMLTRYAGGFSWITYGFSASAPAWGEGRRDYILRLGPADGLFAPYSAAPQFYALKLIEGSLVPAPRVHDWSDDASRLGAPYFIADKSDGDVPIPWGANAMEDATREAVGLQFAELIGDLHCVDWRGSELAKIGPPPTADTAANLQVDQWERNYRRWRLKPHPMVHRAFAWLRANPPTAPRISVIHGDYRLGNFLAQDGRITALLDWELVHLGDPHEDLAWACLPQYRAGSELMSKLVARDTFYARYADRAGFAVDGASMHYYTIFSLLKLAITHMAGVFAFETRGLHDMRLPAMGTQIAPVLRQIEKAVA
jgi:aminoglycoside phosphotransferase (APT) family kinase protein